MRDAARTSPWSHVVVEKVLYGCVCLSVPLRIFTRRRRGPAICSNIPYLLFYYPLTSLTFFFFFAVAVPEISCCHCERRLMLTQVLTFIDKSSVVPTLTSGLFTPQFLCPCL